MRVSVVLLLFSISCAELQRGDDQPAPEDVQPRLNRIQNQSHVERPELLTDQTTVQCDVWTELRELRDMVVEQRVKLQYSERQMEELKKENADLAGRVTSTELKVTSTELALREEDKTLEQRLAFTELEIKSLKEKKTDTPKVAFSFGTGLSGSHGPFSTDSILVLSREITNIGNAFSPITGVFTAPVRGVYYFRYTMSCHSSTHWTTVRLMKNQQPIVVVTKPPKGTHDYAASGATLLLEKGDLVYLRLPANSQIWDDQTNHFSFSGFLLFTM